MFRAKREPKESMRITEFITEDMTPGLKKKRVRTNPCLCDHTAWGGENTRSRVLVFSGLGSQNRFLGETGSTPPGFTSSFAPITTG